MATSNNTIKTASVLAFERKLDPSDALFSAGLWAERENSSAWPWVRIAPKSVRGTISNRLKTKDQDPAKLDAAIQNPNLQTVDVAMLPANSDTLKVAFSLRVLPGAGVPSACNSAEYQARLNEVVQGYARTPGFGELARRYAQNLANGRFLWRNRMGAENVEVRVAHMVDGQAKASWTFDALNTSLRDFSNSGCKGGDVQPLAALIENGLSGQQHVLLHITAFVRVGAGQEVFPSQELILDKDKAGKSKTLYEVNGVAGMHSQKLGNAIRTVDTWYPEADANGPIAVEPYGSVTTQGKAYRQPKDKIDFYNLLDNWLLKNQVPELEQQYFVMAVLIRGGVFGDAS